MRINLFALIGGAAVGFVVGGLISVLYDRSAQRHTGGSFRELYNDNREEGAEKCE